MGKKETYIVIPKIYCSCIDFLINVVERKNVLSCYHLVSQVLAEVYGKYRVLKDISVQKEIAIIDEIEKYGHSLTLLRYLTEK